VGQAEAETVPKTRRDRRGEGEKRGKEKGIYQEREGTRSKRSVRAQARGPFGDRGDRSRHPEGGGRKGPEDFSIGKERKRARGKSPGPRTRFGRRLPVGRWEVGKKGCQKNTGGGRGGIVDGGRKCRGAPVSGHIMRGSGGVLRGRKQLGKVNHEDGGKKMEHGGG